MALFWAKARLAPPPPVEPGLITRLKFLINVPKSGEARSIACLAESNSGEARRVPPQNLTVRGTLWSARACMPQWFRRPCFDWQLNLYRVASVVLPPGV